MIRDIVSEKLKGQDNILVLAYDPDNLMAGEEVVKAALLLGYSIIDYEDPEMFRYYYEENLRPSLEPGEEPGAKIILRYTESGSIPYDICMKSSRVEFSLREMFPKLSYNVVRDLYSDVFDRVQRAYRNYRGPTLGDKGTKEFVLKNVYGIVPELIRDFHDLIKALLIFYYKGEELPGVIARYFDEVLKDNPRLNGFPADIVLEGRGAFFYFIQEQWKSYVEFINGNGEQPVTDFSKYEIRAYMDNLFQENIITPVKRQEKGDYPTWMSAGIVFDVAGNVRNRFELGLSKIREALRDISSYSDWFTIAGIWGEVLVLYYGDFGYSLDSKRFEETKALLHERFKGWLGTHYAGLSSLSYAKAPVMVHKIPWHIHHRWKQGRYRGIALLVMDGMSMDNWHVIKDGLRDGGYIFDEAQCFAWIPTVTSVSRQAIFSGNTPMNFAETLLSTNYDEKHWTRFWMNAGFGQESIAYKRGIKGFNDTGLKELLEDDRIKVIGLVINSIDDIMHGQQLFIKGMHQNIRLWAEESDFRGFLGDLFSKGYEVYITSDHGNIGATGQGSLQEGLAVESSGERVRIYKKDLSSDSILKFKAFEWPGTGLPRQYKYILSDADLAFTAEGKKTVSHGGSAIEEVIVPFIHIRKGDDNASKNRI